MTVRRFRSSALIAAVLVATLPPAAAAKADGPRTPFVVARGHSLFEAPWRIRFGEEKGDGGQSRHATFYFSVGDSAERKEHEGGFYQSFRLPLPRTFIFAPTFGSEFDNFEEGDVAGTAGPLVARIAVKAADGSLFETRTSSAPDDLRQRFPSLRRFRFFDLFFPAAAEPVWVSAYARSGNLLERRPGPAASAAASASLSARADRYRRDG